ncbi:MAG: hypothetical protein N2645_15365 [Clostridia bacterium]|nr:hypothetical protein [Clostridia bacterium]
MNLFPLLVIAITLLGGGGFLAYMKMGKRKTTSSFVGKDQQTANEFINVKDVRDKYLYTRDNKIMMYIKISPIAIDLLSEREKKSLTKQLTAELSAEQKPFKFLAVSRPVDISPLISDYSQLMASTSNQKQKELLRNEMFVMSNYAMSGDVVERQFYIMIWERFEDGIEREISKRCYELTSKFEGCGISCEILNQQDIVRLCNLVNNPAYSHIEDTGFNASIPLFTNMNAEG